MNKRYLVLWFRHLTTDRVIIRRPALKDVPFVLAAPERGRMIVTAANLPAEVQGIGPGMVVADARAVLPSLHVIDHKPDMAARLLNALAEWCIRYTPVAAVDMDDGLILDITGCAHLWGGERAYLKDIVIKLRSSGYDVRGAIADTIGAAWAVSRFGQITPIIEAGRILQALLDLPPAALRLEPAVLARLQKLGFYQIRSFISMPRPALRRRFGQPMLDRLDQTLGFSAEVIAPVCPPEPYQERLPCLEPIVTATGIRIALRHLLQSLCGRLVKESKGVRSAVFKGYRMDGRIVQTGIGTNGPSCQLEHLYRLFELGIPSLEPDLGIELFVLEAPVVEDMPAVQHRLYSTGERQDTGIFELLDRLAARAGMDRIHRYLPQERYWPEHSVKPAESFQQKPAAGWRTDRPRPVHLLAEPAPIRVTAPIPDYPPMVFRYKGKVYNIIKADGPERIEQEWWLQEGLHRDYYCLEDTTGARYWVFRLGHYDIQDKPAWFIHGFFA